MPDEARPVPTLEGYKASLRLETKDSECPICYETRGVVVQLPCFHSHAFCKPCLLVALESRITCPFDTTILHSDIGRPIIETYYRARNQYNNHVWDTFGIPQDPIDRLPAIPGLPNISQLPNRLSLEAHKNDNHELTFRLDKKIGAWALTNYGNAVVARGHLVGQDLLEFRIIMLAMYKFVRSQNTYTAPYGMVSSYLLRGTGAYGLLGQDQRELTNRLIVWSMAPARWAPEISGGERYRNDVVTASMFLAYAWSESALPNDNGELSTT